MSKDAGHAVVSGGRTPVVRLSAKIAEELLIRHET